MGEVESTTLSGYSLTEVASHLQQCIRRGMEFEACYWALEMVGRGFTEHFWRTITIIAIEDIGVADPEVVTAVTTQGQAWMYWKNEKEGLEENAVTFAVLSMCRAEKNREAADILNYISLMRTNGLRLPLTVEALDDCTDTGRERNKKLASETGKTVGQLRCEQFWKTGARLHNRGQGRLMAQSTNGEAVDWSSRLLEKCGKFLGATAEEYYADATSMTPDREAPVPKPNYTLKDMGSGNVKFSGRGMWNFVCDAGAGKCGCPMGMEGSPCMHIKMAETFLGAGQKADTAAPTGFADAAPAEKAQAKAVKTAAEKKADAPKGKNGKKLKAGEIPEGSELDKVVVAKGDGAYGVKSFTGEDSEYTVSPELKACNCPHALRGNHCKHLLAIEQYLRERAEDAGQDGDTGMAQSFEEEADKLKPEITVKKELTTPIGVDDVSADEGSSVGLETDPSGGVYS